MRVPSDFEYAVRDKFVVDEVFGGEVYRRLSIRDGDVVLDLGAHIGSFTRYALHRGAGHVVAVEMLPDNVHRLRDNVDGLEDRVTVIEAAVTGLPVSSAVAVIGKRGNPMGAFVDGTRRLAVGSSRYEERPVDAVWVRDLVTTYRPRLVKFDIEASEYTVISPHAFWLASQGVEQLIGEHHVSSESLLKSSGELHARLLDAGYVASRQPPSRVSGWGTVICYTSPSSVV